MLRAGKSTLAKKMQERTGLPLIHLNHEYYRLGWVKPELKEFKEQRENDGEGKDSGNIE